MYIAKHCEDRHYVEQKRQLHQPAGWLVGAFRLSQNSAVIIKTFLGFELCNVSNLWSAEAGAQVFKNIGTSNVGVFKAV